MKFKKLKAVAAVISLSLLVGCGSKVNTVKTNVNEKTLVYGSHDYTSINPALYEHGEINLLLFNGLTAHDENNKVIPCLAENWEYDKDNLTYTFNLRKDVKWHDGKPFTANDVKFTFDTIENPENNSEIKTNYENIKEIQVVNDNTVKFILKNENVALLDYLTVGIIPKHILENEDISTAEFNRHPIGTGPYKFSNWDEGQSISLVRNEDYFKGEPKINNIVFKIVEDSKARVMQLESGELDLTQVTPKDISKFDKNDKFNVDVMNTSDYRGIMYNFNVPLFKNNRELPNALSYAIDRKAIVKNILLGYGQVAYSPLQKGKYNDENMEKFEYSPEMTRKILEDNGWVLDNENVYEKNGTKLSFELVCPEGDQERIDIAKFAAQQLREVGANVKVAIKSNIDWENQDAYLIGWGSPFDPDDHTYKVFTTDGGANYGYYSNTKIDEILKKARETDVDGERQKYYKEFQEELTKDMPYTLLVYIDAIYVAKSNITGIKTDTTLGHHGVGIFWNVQDWNIE